MIESHISKSEFLLEFFGDVGGRELGNPEQIFTDNPRDILDFIERCKVEGKPAFISVQPRTAHDKVLGIEKIFFDFDYGKKNERLSEKQITRRIQKLTMEVQIFINQLDKFHINPLVVKTRKGFHVYIYFDKIYPIDNDIDFWKEVYRQLQLQFLGCNRHKYKFIDEAILGDIKRLSRVPTSTHEKNGEECIIVKRIMPDLKVERDKFRGIDGYYRLNGLKLKDLQNAIAVTKIKQEKMKQYKENQDNKKERWEITNGYIGKIRPCFQVRMNKGEMGHEQRRALLVEAWYAGYNTEEKMIELFRCFHDFDGDKPQSTCRYQVHYWFERPKPKPYTCENIRKHGWCLGEECLTYKKQMERLKNGFKRT